ncbi:hypothetical protein NQZ79_g4179 [Umbelopsis isabellina]|nr:hypothetical protein NQZ79_g4179 [Umbelopsis isabellina]
MGLSILQLCAQRGSQSGMAPKANLKNGGTDLTFYEHEATVLSFHSILSKLLQDLGNPDLNITSRQLSLFTGQLQQFQEDALGLNATRAANAPFRIPAKLFKVDSNGKLTSSHPLYHILHAAYSYMIEQGWPDFTNFLSTAKKQKVIEMITYIKNILISKNIIRKPRIAFASSVNDQNRKALTKLARTTNASITQDSNDATHILHGAMEDIDSIEEEWFRTLEKRDGRVLIHWWYYPDSYDTWLPETEQFMADPEEPPVHEGAWNITSRWLQESVKYNEWMNEEDYEEIPSDSPEAMEDIQEENNHRKMSRHQRMESDAVSETTTTIGDEQATEVEDVFLDEDKQPLVKVCDVERDRPQTGVKTRKNEFEPYSHGDLTNISCFTYEGLRNGSKRRRVEEEMDTDDPTDLNENTLAAYREAKAYRNVQPIPKELIVPAAAAAWFEPTKVHDIEKLSLPHFFGQEEETDSSYAQEYTQIRDFMMKKYQEDPSEYLTVLACTKDLSGDLEDLMRVHSFLEMWGLINYQVDPRKRPFETSLENEHDAGIMPFQYPESDDDEEDKKELTSLRELYGQMRKEIFDAKLAGMVKPRITTLVADDADPDDPDSGTSVVCDSCKQDCTDARYQSLKIKNTQVCPDCFLEGRFSSTMSSGDFLRVEGGMEKPSPEEEWTTYEQLLLLEAVEKYDDDWLLISEYVGTRSKEQCVTQFLQSPIQDNILKSLTELTEEEKNNTKVPFENAENPVMTMISFLSGAVNPAVGAVAAQSSLRVLLESKNEKDEDDPEDSDDEGTSCFSRKTLEQATSAGLAAAIEQAHALAKHEDAEYEELEQSLVNEQKELEKQRVMLISSINAMMARAPHLSNNTTAASATALSAAAPTTPQNVATPPTTTTTNST